MWKILIADDHPLIRKGLKQIMNDSEFIGTVYECSSGQDVLPMLREKWIDLVILDISLPGKDGLSVLKEIKDEFPLKPILMLSIQPEEQYATRAFRLGASGCLNKATAPEELLNALQMVMQGKRYINEEVSYIILDDLSSGKEELPHLRLSEREYQVMLLIAKGETVGEISRSLNLSVKTISTYRSRLLEKMHLENNAQITHYAFKNNLLLKE
ncbi:MAG: response regulator transcription factor [Spirochaetales bacterium]|nr:response regulator transcription factor [Spirochaetales bacterium]